LKESFPNAFKKGLEQGAHSYTLETFYDGGGNPEVNDGSEGASRFFPVGGGEEDGIGLVNKKATSAISPI